MMGRERRMGRAVVGIYRQAFTPVVPDNTIRLVVVSVGVFVVTPHQYSFFGRGPSADSPLSSSLFFFSYQISARKVAFHIERFFVLVHFQSSDGCFAHRVNTKVPVVRGSRPPSIVALDILQQAVTPSAESCLEIRS